MALTIYVDEDHDLNSVKRIADGVDPTDAVTLQQLQALVGPPLKQSKGIKITPDPAGDIISTRMNVAGGLTNLTGANANELAIFPLLAGGILTDDTGARVDWTVVPPPTNGSDAANKAYVDAMAAGVIPLAAVKAATTGQLTLTTVSVVDGYTLALNDRVLVKDQANAIENGIYISQAGGLIRALDADEEGELRVGSTVFVEQGATQSNSSWAVSFTNADPVDAWTPGTDTSVWVKTSQIAGFIEGPGIDITGNVVSVNVGLGLTTALTTLDVLPADGSIVVDATGVSAGVKPMGGLAKDPAGIFANLAVDGGLVVDTGGFLRIAGTPTVTPARVFTSSVTSTGVFGETFTVTHGLAVPNPSVSVQAGGCEATVDVCRPDIDNVTITLGLTTAGTVFTVTVIG